MQPIVIQLGNLCDSPVNIRGDIHLQVLIEQVTQTLRP